ncbi:Spore coat polysaccharide biosynthesis protein spsA [Fusobacterium necrogenes]|uniref:Spore coat polysaccharide biosynthesis protein spsA n=1 Tax=Fusobacterium necrogenes TaxID=858 RepID=A0A377GZ97_9FUSO|nr:glycosyltransferase family 2 protein [Fusobacterium necrogenes]STO32265.1 Spore coat polysaccharide biosynthesis protein spsA [Fusobacterium necrogenes]
MKRKKISVCMATYNGEDYIKKQIESILNQTLQVDEIIISDDNSNDLTLNIIKKFNNPKIKIIKNLKKGVINNFENSLKESTGDYIFLVDQDDIWELDKVDKIIKSLRKYDLVVHNAKIINSNDDVILKETFFDIRNSKKGILKNLYKNRYIGCCMAFNRKILEKVLPFPKDIPMHDSWIGLIAELYGNVYFETETLIYYRRHENNVTELNNSKNKKLKQLQIRWRLLKNLFIKVIKK